MADQVMRVDGEFRGYVAGAEKAERATKKIGKAAGGIGDEFGKALMKVDILKQGLLKAFQIMEKVNALNVSASMNRDERNISIGVSSASLKADPYKMAAIIENRKGALSKDASADTSFLSALASMAENRKSPLASGEAEAAMTAFNRGGELLAREGGRGLLSKMSEGYSVEQSLKMLGAVNDPYDQALGGLERSNMASGSVIKDESDRSAAGNKTRAFQNSQREFARKNGWSQFITEWTPDMLQEFTATTATKLGSLAPEGSWAKGLAGDGQTGYEKEALNSEAIWALTNQLKETGVGIKAAVTKPNGKTEAP
jgi:hypothetical protein